MFSAQRKELSDGRGVRFIIERDQVALSYSAILHYLRQDADFRLWFNSLLADAPFSAFRWETPPITRETANRPFECVLLNSPTLERSSDREAFAEHFRTRRKNDVVEFRNLGNDAILIVPCPAGPDAAYGHLASFVRNAPAPQQQALWQLVGDAMERRLSESPVWLSTAGAGVSWLHIRLDDRPKYYWYRPYIGWL